MSVAIVRLSVATYRKTFDLNLKGFDAVKISKPFFTNNVFLKN